MGPDQSGPHLEDWPATVSTFRAISSAWTPLYRFVFPILWVVICGAAVPSLGMPHGLLLVPILIIALLSWYVIAGSLMAVQVDDRFLHVSNYRREIQVPLSDVTRITENRLVNIRPVTVHLDRPTAFGTRIKFMPKMRFVLFFSSHPIVAELDDLVANAKSGGQRS